MKKKILSEKQRIAKASEIQNKAYAMGVEMATKHMNTQKEMEKAIKHAGRYMKKEQDKIMPPIEYCPECMSLKRKPNKECVNHNKYWIDKDEGLDRVLQDNLPATHLIEITKEKKKYIVRCVGDYSDIVKGRNTAYELSEAFKTLREARDYYKKSMKDVIDFYKKHGKKAYVGLLEKI